MLCGFFLSSSNCKWSQNYLNVLKSGYMCYALGSLSYNFVLFLWVTDAISDMRGERDSLFVITRYFDWLQGLVQDLSQILGLLTSHYYEYRNASISLKFTLQCKDKFCSATDNLWLKTDGKYLRGKMFWGVWLQFSTSQIFLQVKLQKQKFFFLLHKCEFNASVKPRRILPGEKLGENTHFLDHTCSFSPRRKAGRKARRKQI